MLVMSLLAHGTTLAFDVYSTFLCETMNENVIGGRQYEFFVPMDSGEQQAKLGEHHQLLFLLRRGLLACMAFYALTFWVRMHDWNEETGEYELWQPAVWYTVALCTADLLASFRLLVLMNLKPARTSGNGNRGGFRWNNFVRSFFCYALVLFVPLGMMSGALFELMSLQPGRLFTGAGAGVGTGYGLAAALLVGIALSIGPFNLLGRFSLSGLDLFSTAAAHAVGHAIRTLLFRLVVFPYRLYKCCATKGHGKVVPKDDGETGKQVTSLQERTPGLDEARTAAVMHGWGKVFDMVEGVVMIGLEGNSSAEQSKEEKADVFKLIKLCTLLLTGKKYLRTQPDEQGLGKAQRKAIEQEVQKYFPWEKHAASKLLVALKKILNLESDEPIEIQPSKNELAAALEAEKVAAEKAAAGKVALLKTRAGRRQAASE